MYSSCDQPTAVHLIRRRKSGVPVVWHFGVAFEFEESACLYIVELQRDGMHTLTLRRFANDRAVEIFRTIQHPGLVAAAVHRLSYSIDRAETLSYNPLLQNCEHFARFVVEGKRRSVQVQKILIFGIVAGVAVLLSQQILELILEDKINAETFV